MSNPTVGDARYPGKPRPRATRRRPRNHPIDCEMRGCPEIPQMRTDDEYYYGWYCDKHARVMIPRSRWERARIPAAPVSHGSNARKREAA